MIAYKNLYLFAQQAFIFSKSTFETAEMCEICSKFTKRIPEQSQSCHSGVYFVNFEQNSHIVLVFPLLILNKQMPAG